MLGIRPASPEFSTVNIAPALGTLNHAEGVMPHPLGDIKVSLSRNGINGIDGTVTLPEGLSGQFIWQGKQVSLSAGTQQINL